MKRIVAYLRPHRLEQVKTAVAQLGISGMNVSDCRGTGNSPERAALFGGEAHLVALPLRARLEIVAPDDLAGEVVETIVREAFTGEPGDGKVFVEPVLEAVRVRTGERGETGL